MQIRTLLPTKAITAAILMFSEATLNPPVAHNSQIDTLTLPSRTKFIASESEQKHFIKQRRSRPASHTYAGMPVATRSGPLAQHKIKVLENLGYVTGYDENLNLPAWTTYKLNRHGEIGSNTLTTRTSSLRFRIDYRTNSRIPSSLFTESGYDRGHMAPNDAIETNYGTDAQKETFLMSNVCPQLPDFNRGIWKSLEILEGNKWANAFKEIWVITGPILADSKEKIERKGASVPVPKKFYKIFVDEKDDQIRIMAVIIPQETDSKSNMRNFLRSVREIEQETGLDFDSELPDICEELLETAKTEKLWPLEWEK